MLVYLNCFNDSLNESTSLGSTIWYLCHFCILNRKFFIAFLLFHIFDVLLCRPMLTWVAVLCHLSEPGYMEGGLCPWSTSSRSKCTRQVGTVHSWTVSMIILLPGDKLKTKLPPVHQTLQFCPIYPFKHGNYMKARITLKAGHMDMYIDGYVDTEHFPHGCTQITQDI